MFEGLLNFEGLATIDVALAAFFIAGMVRMRMLSRISSDPTKAFAQLERSIAGAFPGLPVGYTFREVLEKLRHQEVRIDWSRVYEALEGYERSRYGGERNRQSDNGEVIKLARVLNGRRKWWKI